MAKNKVNEFEYLSGPVSWYEFEFQDDNGNKKMIHFFGDWHDLNHLCDPSLKCMKNSKSEKSNCYEFIYFLHQLFDIVIENKKYADLFLEFPYNIQKKDDYQVPENTMIAKIYNEFKDCFQYTKKECKYLPYVRMHYTDLRLAFKEDFTSKEYNKNEISSYLDLLHFLIYDMVFDFYQVAIDPNSTNFRLSIEERMKRINMINLLFDITEKYCQMYQILLQSNNYLNELNQLIHPFLEIIWNNEKYFNQEDINYFLNVLELMKTLKHPKKYMSILGYQLYQLKMDKIMVNGRNISDLIYHFIMDKCYEKIVQLKEYVNYWRSLSQKLVNINNHSDLVNILNYLNEFSNNIFSFLITSVGLYTLDSYLLSRLFRTFSNSPGKKHEPSILSIVYMGDTHVNLEVEFFEKVLKLSPVNKVRNGNQNQCINSPNFKKIFEYFDKM